MAYTKQTWENLPSQTTPINADRLTHIEDGIYDAAATADTAASNASSAISGLADKVDKVEGKGLSTNDFTDALKTKLNNIEAGAEVNVQADYAQNDTTADDYIKNKPTLGTSAYKNSTSVVTDSTDLVESGAVKDIVGWGNKNLFYSPYDTVTLGGYSAVKNPDGKFTVNGIDTVQSRALKLGTFTFKAGITYMLSGCPANVSNQIYLRAADNNYTIQKIDNGDGVEVLFDTDTTLNIEIRCGVNQTMTNVVFSPMIELGDTKTAYEPYHESVEQTLRDAEVVEGKNKLPYPFYETGTKTEHNISIINNGDGTLSIGTSAQTDARVLYGLTGIGATTRRPISDIRNKIIVVNATGNNFGLYLWYYNGATYLDSEYIYVNKVPSIPDNCDSYVLLAQVPSGTTPTGTIKPMIVDATETDYSYEPYYIPLKDVVPNKCDNSVIAPTENGATSSKTYAVGEHFIRDRAFCTCKQAISQGGGFTLNTNYTAGSIADNEMSSFVDITNTVTSLDNLPIGSGYVKFGASVSPTGANFIGQYLLIGDVNSDLALFVYRYGTSQLYNCHRHSGTWSVWKSLIFE